MGVFIPLGFYQLYSSSRKRDPAGIRSGIATLSVYFKIVKILLIILAVIFGIVMMLAMAVNFSAIIVGILIFGAFFALGFYILGLFKTFLDDLAISFNSDRARVPSISKIRTYLIVVLVLAIIGSVIGLLVLELVPEFIAPYIPAEWTLTQLDLEQLLELEYN